LSIQFELIYKEARGFIPWGTNVFYVHGFQPEANAESKAIAAPYHAPSNAAGHTIDANAYNGAFYGN
jgi:hypothetical protein